MKTLVYFASGPCKAAYRNLEFDKIYLIDNCFQGKARNSEDCLANEKIVCLGMDCLKAVDYLRRMNVRIDCFVSLNEGLWEGGGSYAINSDMFLGYVMPLLKETYIHIMNKNYYTRVNNVSMDLPYDCTEINENDPRYIDPMTFTDYAGQQGNARTYLMKRNPLPIKNFVLNNSRIEIIHDSIWLHTTTLDLMLLKFSEPNMFEFFIKKDKVVFLADTSRSAHSNLMAAENVHQNIIKKTADILAYCETNQVARLGMLPLGGHNYPLFYELLKSQQSPYPSVVKMFHLNKLDYQWLMQQLSA